MNVMFDRNIMVKSLSYLSLLQSAIREKHHCDALHRESVPVHETTWDGQTIWEGDVEVFELRGHAEAIKCYAWSDHQEHKVRYVTVLKKPPVDSATMAVRSAIFYDVQHVQPLHQNQHARL